MSHIARWIFVGSRSFVPERLPSCVQCVYVTGHYNRVCSRPPFAEEVVDTSQPRTEERLYSPRLNLKRSFWKFARRVYLFRRRPSGQGGAGGLRLTLN